VTGIDTEKTAAENLTMKTKTVVVEVHHVPQKTITFTLYSWTCPKCRSRFSQAGAPFKKKPKCDHRWQSPEH
jgi:hypothetical protein